MKKALLLSFGLVLTITLASAQRTADIGISGGVVHYIGDLANEKTIPFSAMGAGSSVTIRNFLNNPKSSGVQYRKLDMQLRFSWHRLQYDETSPIGGKSGMDLRNYLRGLNFRNDLFGTEIGFTYNITPNAKARLHKPKMSYFVMAGVGVFYGKPKADLFRGSTDINNRYHYWKDGTIRDVAENSGVAGNVIEKDGEYETDLSQWRTEGQGFGKEVNSVQPYSNWNIGIPLGAGIRYMHNKYLTITAEFNYYHFFTDYLDDVSGRYATYVELQSSFPDKAKYELAKYISDPTGRGTNGVIGPGTSPRGNPNMRDGFTYFSLEAAYKITWKRKGVYGR